MNRRLKAGIAGITCSCAKAISIVGVVKGNNINFGIKDIPELQPSIVAFTAIPNITFMKKGNKKMILVSCHNQNLTCDSLYELKSSCTGNT